ncbi:hypothetical protein Tco_1302959 [Tanacetum coccineum]
MNSTKASSSNPSKKIKLTIIPPRQLFVNISSDEDVTTTPSPTTTSSYPTPPNAPSKTTSTNQTSSSQENTSSSFQSKLQISPPSSNEPTSPHLLNPLLENISDVPPRPLNPQPLQSHPSLDITLSLSPITPLDHIHDTPSPPYPPQPHHLSWATLFTTTTMTTMGQIAKRSYDSDMGDDVDISELTIEQYMALIQDNNRLGIVKHKIGDDIEFEINSNFMRELRCKLFVGASLEVEKWLPVGMINTWDLLEKEFIWQYCSRFKTSKKLEEIRNFKQEIDETLYHAWKRYSDFLYRFLQHDLNCQ